MSDPVLIALIGALASSPVLTALLNGRTRRAAHEARDEAREAKKAIGQPNGHGDVVTMLEGLIKRESETVMRLSHIEAVVTRQAGQIAGMETLQLNHESRLRRLEPGS